MPSFICSFSLRREMSGVAYLDKESTHLSCKYVCQLVPDLADLLI